MKKFILGLTCGIALSAVTAVYASETIQATLFPVQYVVNGQIRTLDGLPTLNVKGSAYVPIRFLAENMGANVGYEDKTKTIKLNYNNDLRQLVRTKSYSLVVPKTWTVDKHQDNVLSFREDGKEIGGLEIEGYIPPDAPFFPNHAELVEKKTLDGFFTTVIQALFNRTQPAASQNPSITKETRFYFLIDEKNEAYDLYFNQDLVDEQTMLHIARSLTPLE